MNCKPGDLARYVGSDKDCYGWIVLCVQIHPQSPPGLPCWVVSPPMPGEFGGYADGVADQALRPIRPSDGADETLTRAGKPEPIEEATEA